MLKRLRQAASTHDCRRTARLRVSRSPPVFDKDRRSRGDQLLALDDRISRDELSLPAPLRQRAAQETGALRRWPFLSSRVPDARSCALHGASFEQGNRAVFSMLIASIIELHNPFAYRTSFVPRQEWTAPLRLVVNWHEERSGASHFSSELR